MRFLVIGANGQVGHALLAALAPLGDVVASTRSGQLPDGRACLAADVADTASLAGLVHRAAADVVVNASAYTAVDRAEDEPHPLRRERSADHPRPHCVVDRIRDRRQRPVDPDLGDGLRPPRPGRFLARDEDRLDLGRIEG